MKTLALELSTARGSVAWLDGDTEISREWPNDRKNSAAFFESIDTVAKKFGAPDVIVVGLGPGSYAGTRIAISTAIGLSLGGGTGSVPSLELGRHGGRPSINLIGYPSICAMEGNEYCVVGDARRSSFFFAHVRGNALVEGPTLFAETEVKDRIRDLDPDLPIFASEMLSQFERAVVRFPAALILARLAQKPEHGFSLPPLEPMYLREPHITTPK
ncbi:MAG: tRNA (adenosine(37)-N6)-threonylcarbamoyltransferase complex dimerization subunit type 1 TsaB [Verrucomicrobiota bacterium]